MSDISSGIILEDKLWIITNYTNLSAAVFWMVDFAHTFPIEVATVWSRKLTGTAIIFLLNRYTYGVATIASVVFQSPGSATDESCRLLNIVTSIFSTVALVTTNLLFTLRIYAICGESMPILVVALSLLLVRFGVVIWQSTPSMYMGQKTAGTPFKAFSMCQGIISDSAEYQRSAVITAILPLVFDSFVFGVTIFKTFRHAREMRKHGQRSITDVILRDGTLYFLTVFVAASVSLALQVISIVQGDSSLVGSTLSNYFFVLPNLLANRLYLNLRTLILPLPVGSFKYASCDMSEPTFAQNRFLGKIGAPLDADHWHSTLFDDEMDSKELSVDVPKEQDESITVASTGNNGATTLVPVVYGQIEGDDIELVPIRR